MPRLTKGVAIGLATGLIGLLFSLAPFGYDLEEQIGLNLLFQMRGPRNPPPDVALVTIDKVTAEHLNVPIVVDSDYSEWPRDLHARLIDKLVEGGAAVIAFDIIFRSNGPPETDRRLADSIHGARNVILSQYIDTRTVHESEKLRGFEDTLVSPIALFAASAAALAPFPLPSTRVRVAQYWTFARRGGDLPTLPTTALQLFASRRYPDQLDRLIGHLPAPAGPYADADDTPRPARLFRDGILGLRDGLRADPTLAETVSAAIEPPVPGTETVGGADVIRALVAMYHRPDSRYLNFYGGAGTIPTISYCRVLGCPLAHGGQGTDPVDLRDKMVFVGLSEAGQPGKKLDGFLTVWSGRSAERTSGVEIAATAFANLLEGRPLAPLNAIPQAGLVFGWGMMLGVASYLLPVALAAAGSVAACLLYFFGAAYLFGQTAVWCPLVTPLFLQAPLAFFIAVIWKYNNTLRERKRIRIAFGHYLPDSVVDQLAGNIGDVTTPNKSVFGTCLLTDAGQYTTLSETLPPERLSRIMNAYYNTMFGPVKQHGGTVINVVGDSMLAIWATDRPDVDFRRRACLAAIEIERITRSFRHPDQTTPLPTRIGLHAGQMVLGSIGAMDHFEYRPIGDIVNTASRMEGLNKFLGTHILVSAEVLHRLEDFAARELGRFLMPGKTRPILRL